MRRTLLACALAAFVLTSPETAAAGRIAAEQSNPTQPEDLELPQLEGGLSPHARAALTQNRRIRVIVMLDASSVEPPSGARDGLAQPAPLTSDQIARLRDDVLGHAFGEGGVYRPDPHTDEAARIEDETRPTLMRSFSVTPGFSLLATASQIKQLNRAPGVAYIAEDRLSRPFLDESTALIGADQLWAQGIEGAGVAVAILDTGVEKEHPMTGPAITASACFSSTVPAVSSSLCAGGVQQATSLTGALAGDSCVEDDLDSVNGVDGCGHGTHVASTAAGRTANAGSGPISGVARAADIIAVNVFSKFVASECGDGAIAPCVQSYSSDLISALEWVYQNRAALRVRAVNMSLGGGEYSGACDDDPLAPIIEELRGEGIATVIASGNDGFPQAVSAPGCISAAITVGSTTKEDAVSPFSNSSPLVDLLAPGSSILAAFQSEYVGPGGSCSLGGTPNGLNFCHYFATSSGTSMAAPHVAGAFALLAAAFPDASVSEIEAALEFTGQAVTDTKNWRTLPRIRVTSAHAYLGNGGAMISGLRIDPAEPYSVTGAVDDPSGFTSKIYTLSNESGASLDYTVSSDRSWLVADSTGGRLAAGADVEIVVSVDLAELHIGTNEAVLTFAVMGGESQAIPATAVLHPRPPLNDDFENAFPLVGISTDTSARNTRAGKQPGEPDHADPGGASVWWAWTAPFNGTIEIDTEGSDFDTTLAVYKGSALGNLTQLAENDDIDPGVNRVSRVSFAAISGETYHIAVDGGNGESGFINLELRLANRPSNDDFANAEALSGSRGSQTGFTVNATMEPGEPDHQQTSQTDQATIWYSWTAPSSGDFRFTLDGTNQSIAIAAYIGAAVDALTLVAKNRDHTDSLGLLPAEPALTMEFAAEQGTTYKIALVSMSYSDVVTRLSWSAVEETTSLLSAILPYARSVQLGQTATAFLSVLNNGDVTAHNCSIAAPPDENFPGALVYQTTDPATNALTGSPNTPVSIPAGDIQTFVFGVTLNRHRSATEFGLLAICDNAQAPIALEGVNTFILSSTEEATADILPIAATITGNGIVELPSTTGTEVFTVAAVNIGTEANIELSATTWLADVTICETDNLGNCFAPPESAVQTVFAGSETRFFSIFVTGKGEAIPFDPARNRIIAQFTEDGVVRGATNVAVRTP